MLAHPLKDLDVMDDRMSALPDPEKSAVPIFPQPRTDGPCHARVLCSPQVGGRRGHGVVRLRRRPPGGVVLLPQAAEGERRLVELRIGLQ